MTRLSCVPLPTSAGVKMKGAEVAGRPKRGQVRLEDQSGPFFFFPSWMGRQRKKAAGEGGGMRQEGVKEKGHSAL